LHEPNTELGALSIDVVDIANVDKLNCISHTVRNNGKRQSQLLEGCINRVGNGEFVVECFVMEFNRENGWVIFRGDSPFHSNFALGRGIDQRLDGKSSRERNESEKSELGEHSF